MRGCLLVWSPSLASGARLCCDSLPLTNLNLNLCMTLDILRTVERPNPTSASTVEAAETPRTFPAISALRIADLPRSVATRCVVGARWHDPICRCLSPTQRHAATSSPNWVHWMYLVAHCAVRTTEATDDVFTNTANSVWAHNHGEVISTHTSCISYQTDPLGQSPPCIPPLRNGVIAWLLKFCSLQLPNCEDLWSPNRFVFLTIFPNPDDLPSPTIFMSPSTCPKLDDLPDPNVWVPSTPKPGDLPGPNTFTSPPFSSSSGNTGKSSWCNHIPAMMNTQRREIKQMRLEHFCTNYEIEDTAVHVIRYERDVSTSRPSMALLWDRRMHYVRWHVATVIASFSPRRFAEALMVWGVYIHLRDVSRPGKWRTTSSEVETTALAHVACAPHESGIPVDGFCCRISQRQIHSWTFTMRSIAPWRCALLPWAQAPWRLPLLRRLLKWSSGRNPATKIWSPRTCVTRNSTMRPSGKRYLHHCSLRSEKNQRTWNKLITLMKKVCCQLSPFSHVQVRGDSCTNQVQVRLKKNGNQVATSKTSESGFSFKDKKEQILAEVRSEIQKHELQAESGRRSIQELTGIVDSQRMEIDHTITGCEQSRRDQLLLQEELSEQNRGSSWKLVSGICETWRIAGKSRVKGRGTFKKKMDWRPEHNYGAKSQSSGMTEWSQLYEWLKRF